MLWSPSKANKISSKIQNDKNLVFALFIFEIYSDMTEENYWGLLKFTLVSWKCQSCNLLKYLKFATGFHTIFLYCIIVPAVSNVALWKLQKHKFVSNRVSYLI